MTGASYLAGASYDRLAARAGHAGGALAVLAALVVVLILTGRWLGRRPGPLGFTLLDAGRFRLLDAGRYRSAAGVALSLGALFVLAGLLVVAVPAVVRFSGLDAVDAAIARWAESQWTSDGYLFALRTATATDPAALFGVAAAASLGRWWWLRRRGRAANLLSALGPVLPIAVLAAVFEWTTASAWRAPDSVVFPGLSEFDGYIPFDAAGRMASLAAGDTAQLAAALGLLAWLLAGRLPWRWQVTVWTVASIYVVVCAGSWVYLGWSRTSETVGALLVGVAWTVLNAAIWSARESRPEVRKVPERESVLCP
jgi:undecaprenyl-diphosphatase